MASRITTYLIVLIVTGTLVAGLIVGAQRDEADGPVDLIITNGKVYTARQRRRSPKRSPCAATRSCASAATARSSGCAVRRR